MKKILDRRPWLIDWAIVLLLLAVALAVRYYHLRTIPFGLYNDETAYANDALAVLDGHFAIFFERNGGREPLYIYLLALAFELFGSTPYVIRATAALLGSLTIPATYLLVKAATAFEFPRRPGFARMMGIWVALFMAFSYWHLSFSRVGFRAITLPLFLSLTFYFVWRGWRQLRDEEPFPWGNLVMAGLCTGLTLYTYTAGRMVVALFAFVAIYTFLQPVRMGIARSRVVKATAVVALVSALTALPLGLYFLANPESFSSRAAVVSIYSAEFAPDGPARALVDNVKKMALMFLTEADPNDRHNQAGIPVVDPILGIVLYASALLALVQWRRLPQLTWLIWVLLLAVPALLSAEGMPHSLRMIGLMPAIFALPVSGLMWAGERLLQHPILSRGRLRRRLAMLVPLPFLLISSILGVRAYFGAWQDPERFRAAFLTDYVILGQSLATQSGDALWLLTLSPNYGMNEERIENIEFFVRGRVPYASLLLKPDRFGASLTERLAGALAAEDGRKIVNVLRPYDAPQLTETSFVFLDARRLADFVLRRTGGRVIGEKVLDGFPYTIYEVGDGNLSVPPVEERTPQGFGGRLELTGSAIGGPGDDAQPTGMPTIRADETLWAALRFRALEPIDIDLKTSLLLIDGAGHVVGQYDGLLTSDRYPVERVWQAGEEATTWHIVEPLPAVPPGEYRLMLRIYEDQSGRIYAPAAQEGVEAQALEIGRITITPPGTLPNVNPSMNAEGPAAGGVALLGLDMPRAEVSPGDRLPLTLYWQATEAPEVDWQRRVRVLDAAGTAIAEVVGPPGGSQYATSAWRSGEVLRDWLSVPLSPESTTGDYRIVVDLFESGRETAPTGLQGATAEVATVRVQGRPRLFAQPAIDLPAGGTFGSAVRLIGLQGAQQVTASGSDTVQFDLVWQPLAEQSDNLVRFTHLLDGAGQLVAQQDTTPCESACPSTSWLADEFLIDRVALSLPPDLSPGRYTLVTGWYNPATQQRLVARDASGAAAANDAIGLPVTLTVE